MRRNGVGIAVATLIVVACMASASVSAASESAPAQAGVEGQPSPTPGITGDIIVLEPGDRWPVPVDGATYGLRAGVTYHIKSTWFIGADNVTVTRVGSGDLPVLRWTGGVRPGRFPRILEPTGNRFTLAYVRLDGGTDNPTRSNDGFVRGIRPKGHGHVVANCEFRRLSDAVNSELGVTDYTLSHCDTDVLGAYFIWCQGDGFTIEHNVVADSNNEHNIRGRSASNVTIRHNRLTNPGKSCVWLLEGETALIENNTFIDGSVAIGPHTQEPGDRSYRGAVIRDNTFERSAFVFHAGAVGGRLIGNTFRNCRSTNVIAINQGGPTNRDGVPLGRTCSDITIARNIVVDSKRKARCIVVQWGSVPGLIVTGNDTTKAPLCSWGENGLSFVAYDRQDDLTSTLNRWRAASEEGCKTIPCWDGGGRTEAQWLAEHPEDSFAD